MNREAAVSDELVNALVDDQLDAPERDCVLDAVNHDAALKLRACELHGLKQMVRHAYPISEAPVGGERSRSGGRVPPLQAPGRRFQPVIDGLTGGRVLDRRDGPCREDRGGGPLPTLQR